jgi:hypothetical protein
MALLGLALFLSFLPTDACKQCGTTACNCNKTDNVLYPVYGNATISNTAGRAPVPTTVSLSKPPMNVTRTTHAASQHLGGTRPHGTNVIGVIVVPESVDHSPQVPLSCLRPDVTCTLQTTITSIIATKTVPAVIPSGPSLETADGGYTNMTEVVKTDASSPTSIGSHGGPSASTTSREKPVFSYDPIKISTTSTAAGNVASPSPTTSGSLNALSVLESALSAITTISPSTTAVETSSSRPDQGSGWIYFPYPTVASEASSHTQEQPISKSTSETAQSMGATHTLSPASSTTNSATSITSPNEDPAPHFTLQPTSDDDLSNSESTSSPVESTSHSETSLTYSPLQSTTPATLLPPTSSPTQTILAFGSLTITANAVSTLSQIINVGGTTLSAGGAPVTLEQGEVLSYATDGLVVAKPSGVVHSMSTVAAPEETGQVSSGELPEVVQQPAPSESSSGTTSAVDATSTDSGEAEGDSSNGSGRLVRAHGMALVIGVAVVVFVV